MADTSGLVAIPQPSRIIRITFLPIVIIFRFSHYSASFSEIYDLNNEFSAKLINDGIVLAEFKM
jgi:hypothetical protein